MCLVSILVKLCVNVCINQPKKLLLVLQKLQYAVLLHTHAYIDERQSPVNDQERTWPSLFASGDGHKTP